MRLGQNEAMHVDAIPTGSLSLDLALGIGGLPRGRIVEIYGPESSGKPLWPSIASRKGRKAAVMPRSSTWSTPWIRLMPGPWEWMWIPCWFPSRIPVSRLWKLPRLWSRSGAIDVIVVDSVAALVPRAEIEGEMGDSHVGLQARLMSQALRKLAGAISKSNCVAIFINQLREKGRRDVRQS